MKNELPCRNYKGNKAVKTGQYIWAKMAADYIQYLRRTLAIFKVAQV